MVNEWQYHEAAEAGSYWAKAQQALDQFNRRYTEAQKLFRSSDSPEDVEKGEKLLTWFAFRHEGTAPTFEGPFVEWMNYAFTQVDIVKADKARPRGDTVLAVLDGKRDVGDFLRDLEGYRDAIEAVIKSVAPEQFSYQGFTIYNPERLGEHICMRLLEGADYLTALFKKRGVEPLLHTGVKHVELLPDPLVKGQTSAGKAVGLYHSGTKTITLSTSILHGNGRFIDWVNEVFLHEFGHYVHFGYLPRAAKEAWDSGWQEVKNKQEEFTKAFESISASDRARYFDALVFTDFEAGKAAKKLNAIDKVKFGVWLRTPMVGDPLIKPKQFRWTNRGSELAWFFVNRDDYMRSNYDWLTKGTPEYDRQVEITTRRFHDHLGLLWEGSYRIPQQTVAELSQSDPTIQRAVQDALAKLEIVSEYGKTDEREDFAETFVAFLGAPEKLTPTAKFRMQRALSLANFYNKPVMRLAHEPMERRIVARYLTSGAIADPKTQLHAFQNMVEAYTSKEDFAKAEVKKLKTLIVAIERQDSGLAQILVNELKISKGSRYDIRLDLEYQRSFSRGKATAQPLFWAILQQYVLPPSVRRSVEAANRWWSKKRLSFRFKQSYGTYDYDIEVLEKYLDLCAELQKQVSTAQAAIVKGKLHDDPSVAEETTLRAGSFRLVNTGGFDAATMAKAADIVSKAEKAMRSIGLGKVCYGDILVSKTVNNKKTVAAFYLNANDEMFIRANTPSSWPTMRIVCHELAHRLHNKFLQSKTSEINALYRTLKTEAFVSKLVPSSFFPQRNEEMVDEKGAKLTVIEVSYNSQKVKWKKEGDPPNVAYSAPIQVWLEMKGLKPHMVEGFKGFVTRYAGTDPGENFAEMVSFYAIGELPKSQIELLVPILG